MSQKKVDTPAQEGEQQGHILPGNTQTSGEKERQPKVSRKNEKPAPTSLYEFVKEIFKGRTILKDDHKMVVIFDDTLTEERKNEILELANLHDKDLKTTLALSEFTLEGIGYSRNKDQILSVVEYIVSNQGSLKKVRSNSIFQQWLDNNEDSADKLKFFYGQISRIEESDAQGRTKALKDSKRNNILGIAAIWLYLKRAADFSSLISYLSRTVFDLKGESGSQVESGAFAFAASMITSTKKQKFAYLIKRFISVEENLKSEIKRKNIENRGLINDLEDKKHKLQSMHESMQKHRARIEEFESKVDALNNEISQRDEAATHAKIHHEDNKDEIKTRLALLLEKDLTTLVEKARVANSRTPPKTTVIDYQLNEVLELIEKELKWLRS